MPYAAEPLPGTAGEAGVRDDHEAVVDVHSLLVRFGEVDAVRNIDLTVARGGSVALVGRNGAGKSTTLRVLAGVVPATGGSVHVGGVDVRRHPLAAKHLVGYCPDVGGLVPGPRRGSTCSSRRGCEACAAGSTGPGTCSSGSTSPPPRIG